MIKQFFHEHSGTPHSDQCNENARQGEFLIRQNNIFYAKAFLNTLILKKSSY